MQTKTLNHNLSMVMGEKKQRLFESPNNVKEEDILYKKE